jgi:hypothetical protein
MKRKLAALAAAISVLGAGLFFAMPSQAATNQLSTLQTCLPDGTVRVDFSWTGNEPSSTQQWLDLSLWDNQWEWGTFLGNGPLPGNQSKLRWDGLIPNATHYVRLNQQLVNAAWDPSPTFVFTTRSCSTPPVDGMVRAPAPIDDVKVMPLLDGAYSLQIMAGLPGGCARPDGHEFNRTGDDIVVKVWNKVPNDGRPCTAIYGMYDVNIPLGNLTPGQTYRITVNEEVITYRP